MSGAPSFAALRALESALASFRISSQRAPAVGVLSRRHASHQAQGRANGAKDGAGKRLGSKKGSGQYVVPGTILYRQRGTLWFPGDNCFMGRDHTIHASAPGFVTFYRDPLRHPKRKYIGIVFEKGQTLPAPVNAVRRRKLGMLAFEMSGTETNVKPVGNFAPIAQPDLPEAASKPATVVRQRPQSARRTVNIKVGKKGDKQDITLTLQRGYNYRQANWEIGRAAERSKEAQQVEPFKPGDRFAAWRKRTLRRAKNAERRAMGRGGKGKKK